MRSQQIVIVGGGVGGIVAANELRRRLPRQHRIALVERSPLHTFAPSFLWVMIGDRRPSQITRPVRALVRPFVEVVQAEACHLDLPNQRVATRTERLAYDHLVVALGADLTPEAIPGLAAGAHTFYSLEGAVRLHEALEGFSGGIIALVVSALPYKCPGAPHEAAMLMADFFRRRGRRGKVEIHLFTPEPQPMPVAGPALGEMVRRMLEAKGICFHPLHKLAAVDAPARELSFEDKAAFRYDLLVAIPPHRGPGLVRETGLPNQAGWVPVDRATLATGQPNVYAIGDATAIAIPGRWQPEVPLMLPKAGVFAHAQAEVVARRLAALISGREAQDTFCGGGYCMLEAGEDLAGFAFGDFFAEPVPQLQLRQIGRAWHWGKVLFEQWWLSPLGLRRQMLRSGLVWGGKILGIPVVI